MNKERRSKGLFITGIMLNLIDAVLLVLGVISSPLAAIICIVGIGLIAMSNFRLLK